MSGVVYLVNDIVDRGSDRQHPIKQRRPIASGALPLPIAFVAVIILGAASLAGAAALGGAFALTAGSYLGLQACTPAC